MQFAFGWRQLDWPFYLTACLKATAPLIFKSGSLWQVRVFCCFFKKNLLLQTCFSNLPNLYGRRRTSYLSLNVLVFYEFFSCSSNIMQLDVELTKNPGKCFLDATCDSLHLISMFVKGQGAAFCLPIFFL